MKDLAQLPAYLLDDTGYWRRMPFVVGGFMCVAGTLNIWFTIGSVLQPWEIVARGVAGGVLFALLFPFLFRLFMRWSVRRTFAKAGPAGAMYRLVCSIRKSPRMMVPGALYLFRDVAAFTPHRLQALGRDVSLPLEELSVSSEQVPRGWLMRLLTARDPLVMRLTTSTQSEAFVVPTPRVTIGVLSSVVKEMRGGVPGNSS
jgi:hypothetical protein